MTDPTKPTPEDIDDIAAAEDDGDVVDQQTANEAATEE